jgi:hypothetical protein
MGTNRATIIRDASNPTKLLKVSAEGTILVKTFGSSVKSVGEFWLRKFAKYVI